MKRVKKQKFKRGDLVLARISTKWKENQSFKPGVVVYGNEVSFHVMDRPKRIVDTFQYGIIIEGKISSFYEEDICFLKSKDKQLDDHVYI